MRALEDPALLVVAARVGGVRLIDNVPLVIPTRRTDVPPRTRTTLKSKIHRPVDESQLDGYEPLVVHVDAANRRVEVPTAATYEGVPASWDAR
jgi:hypothetical protein